MQKYRIFIACFAYLGDNHNVFEAGVFHKLIAFISCSQLQCNIDFCNEYIVTIQEGKERKKLGARHIDENYLCYSLKNKILNCATTDYGKI